MKTFTTLFFLFAFLIGNTQSIPMDFETVVSTSDFIDFDGGIAMVIDNPQANGINTSSKVAQIVRDGGQIWGGSKIVLTENIDFTSMSSLSMKVFTTAPVGTQVKFKLEGVGETERDVNTTVSGAWEVLTWDFTGAPNDFNTLVFMFDFGNVGDGTDNSTFLFDDIEQTAGAGAQIDLPVSFEDAAVNYTMTDFGGNASSMIIDPTDPSNTVMQSIKTGEAATWAGTTIGTPAGFATNIPLSLTDSKMNIKVWSPAEGTPIRLKVEDANDPTHTCETEINTTTTEAWEVLVFDFANEAPGTAKLSDGLAMGWTYNKASIFFNFGTEGSVAGEQTYYFDDVEFGDFISGLHVLEAEEFKLFPNPSKQDWTVSSNGLIMNKIEVYDAQGRLLQTQEPNEVNAIILGTNLNSGIYYAKVSTDAGYSLMKLVKND